MILLMRKKNCKKKYDQLDKVFFYFLLTTSQKNVCVGHVCMFAPLLHPMLELNG
jgi:hypothetical protein